MAELRRISPGSMVRLVGFGTPSQRRSIWINDEEIVGTWGYIKIHRQEDEDCMMIVPSERLEPTTVLDLLVSE